MTGTLLSLVLYAAGKSFIADDTEASIGDKLHSFDETLTHAASETAFVTVWVLVAYLVRRPNVATGISESDLAAGGWSYGSGSGCFNRFDPDVALKLSHLLHTSRGSFPSLRWSQTQYHRMEMPYFLSWYVIGRFLWATVHTLFPGLICGMILLSFELTFHEDISSHAFFKNQSSGVSKLMWMWGLQPQNERI